MTIFKIEKPVISIDKECVDWLLLNKFLLSNSATMGSLMAGWDSHTLDPKSGTDNWY